MADETAIPGSGVREILDLVVAHSGPGTYEEGAVDRVLEKLKGRKFETRKSMVDAMNAALKLERLPAPLWECT